jgi:NADH:ubiquinone oxidoreductase subunit 3 (subunit A)
MKSRFRETFRDETLWEGKHFLGVLGLFVLFDIDFCFWEFWNIDQDGINAWN